MGREGITPERFAARVKKHRELKGYSQRELADLAGLTKGTISKYENGGLAKLPHAVALSRALGVAFNYLIGFIDDPYDIESKELQNIWNELPESERATLFEYGGYLLSKAKKDKK